MPNVISLSSWNLRAGLSDPERSSQLIDTITGWQSDIVVMPDAWHSGSTSHSMLPVIKAFESQGYDMHAVEFQETRPDVNSATLHFATLIKQGFTPVTPSAERLGVKPSVRPAFRLETEVGNVALDIFGLYLNDQSAHNRLHQIDSFIKWFEIDLNRPKVIIGDLNDLPRNTKPARLARSSVFRKTLGRLHMAHDLFPRLTDMGEGSAIGQLEDLGFRATLYDGTMPSLLPILRLDHILEYGLSANNLTINTKIGEYSKLSDHRSIHATVSSPQ